MASRSLDDLHPSVRERAVAWKKDCSDAGIDVLIYCTYRSAAEQGELYKVGRTVKGEGVTAKRPMGRTVTNARGGNSLHQYRCAWDCVPMSGGKPQWNDAATYKRMASIAKKHGIEWAGEWVSFKEQAHFQFTNGLTLAELKQGKIP